MPPAAGTGRGGEFYYVLIFGSQSSPKILRYTHTWATLVRVVGEGPDPRNYEIYAHTISWLPETLELRVWRPWPEPGVNLDLYQTLDVVYSNRERVTMWGPLLIEKKMAHPAFRGVIPKCMRGGYNLVLGAGIWRMVSHYLGWCVHGC